MNILIQTMFFWMMKTNSVRGDLTDISIKQEALLAILAFKVRSQVYPADKECGLLCIFMYVSYYNSTASTWTLATRSNNWESVLPLPSPEASVRRSGV